MNTVKTLALTAIAIALSACATQAVPPITAAPTNHRDPGQVVWADLLTNDVATAKDFYAEVFGWQFASSGDGQYEHASHDGTPVAGIAYHAPRDPQVSEVMWLVSVSVDDVDAAVDAATDAGGTVLEAARDVLERGRFAIIADDQGAPLVLLKSTSGDPIHRRSVDNEWIWAELWASDPGSAAEFYAATIGYESRTITEADGDDYVVLVRDGEPKTGIVKLPRENVEPNWLPYLRVADVAATIAKVEAAGGAVLIAPSQQYDEGRVAMVSDPTGGVFAIQARRAAQ